MAWSGAGAGRVTKRPAAGTAMKRGALLGLCLAVAAVAGLHWPLASQAEIGLALFLSLTACVYPGALLAQVAMRNVAVGEVMVGIVVFGCAWLGLLYGAVWLAVGYALHGVWDWLHHRKVVPVRTREWFPPACAVFDAVIAAYALVGI